MGESAAEKYNEFTDYQKAVFVNTVVAAVGVGADFSSAKFLDFYRADYGYENGIYVDGLKGTTRGRNKIGGGFFSFSVGASVEFEDDHIDVDLYHLASAFLVGGAIKHDMEVNFNKRHRRGTHPGDVVIQLAERGVNTGVSCKRK